jgi:hypothetical protein
MAIFLGSLFDDTLHQIHHPGALYPAVITITRG